MGNDEKGGKSVLLELVERAKCWIALGVLKRSTLVERMEIATKAFGEACAHHDDEDALQWFTWLLQAIQEDEDSRPEPTEAMGYKAKEAAKKLAEIRVILIKADVAKALYPELPKFRLEPSRYRDDPGIKHPTLLKTKKAMLKAIAVGWKSAPTNEVADEFFMFIYKIDGDWDVQELINETIRKVTDSIFPLARLMYTLRNHQGVFEDILGLAWVRNSPSYSYGYPNSGSKAGLILGAVGDFFEASPEATKLLGHIGAKILVVDRQLNSLNNQPPVSMFTSPKLEFVYDNFGLDEVLARFKIVVSEEKDFHKEFEQIRDRILEAKKGWSVLIRIKLRGEYKVRYKNQITLPRTEDL